MDVAVVVGLEVMVVVGDEVAVVVVVGDVVAVVLGLDVSVVVGVVTSHPWKPPWLKASTIAFNVPVVLWQSVGSYSISPNAHSTVSPLPSGPRNSRKAALIALAVPAQLSAATTGKFPITSDLQVTSAGTAVGHAFSTALRALTCASHDCPALIKMTGVDPASHENAPWNTVVVGVVVTVVVVVGLVVAEVVRVEVGVVDALLVTVVD